MRKDSLEKQLQSRPKPEELVREGILERKFTFQYFLPLSPCMVEDVPNIRVGKRWRLVNGGAR